MRIFIFCLALYGALVFHGFSASAQEADPGENQPQNIAEQEINPAVIIDAWDIDPFERVNGMPSGSCLMSASYSNGLELAFKGRAGRLTALRVKADRRETRGDIRGFVILNLNDRNYELQARTNGNQADASLLTVPAAGELLGETPVFKITIGDKDYAFSTAGFEAGYEALFDCLGNNSLTTLKVVDHSGLMRRERQPKPAEDNVAIPEIIEDEVADNDPLLPTELTNESSKDREMPLAMALTTLIPSGYSFNFDGRVDGMATVAWTEEGSWQDKLTQAAASQGYVVTVNDKNVRIDVEAPVEEVAQSEAEAQKEIPAEPVALVEKQADVVETMTEEDVLTNRQASVKPATQWSAQKGERVDDILRRWAGQAGVNAQIELDNPPAVAKDFTLTGAFEVAVNELLEVSSQNRAVKPSAVLTHGGNKVTHVSGYEGGIMAKPEHIGGNRWRALEGSNLRKALQRWSVKNGVSFMWEADQMFFIPQSVNTTTDFPEAVALLLSQFEGQPVRPTAILNNDPDTGQTALIIRTTARAAE